MKRTRTGDSLGTAAYSPSWLLFGDAPGRSYLKGKGERGLFPPGHTASSPQSPRLSVLSLDFNQEKLHNHSASKFRLLLSLAFLSQATLISTSTDQAIVTISPQTHWKHKPGPSNALFLTPQAPPNLLCFQHQVMHSYIFPPAPSPKLSCSKKGATTSW